MREPRAFAQRNGISGEEPDSISGEEPDSFNEPDSFSFGQPDPVSGYEPDSVSQPDCDAVFDSEGLALAPIGRGRVRCYPASCQSRRSPLGSTMSAIGIATSQLGAPSALTRISMTSESRRRAIPAQSLRKANTTGRTRFST
jgi:hypothetical protein